MLSKSEGANNQRGLRETAPDFWGLVNIFEWIQMPRTPWLMKGVLMECIPRVKQDGAPCRLPVGAALVTPLPAYETSTDGPHDDVGAFAS
ncbi:MAG: hypothetical protein VX589_16855 [Myxococcota bacterium]|nr:hypothetical protein [Myxococcota bacterium]